jgi:hypothetical protein
MPNLMPDAVMMTSEATTPGSRSQTEPLVTMGRFVLFVSVVLATTVSVFATWRPQDSRPDRPPIRARSW